MLALQLVTCPLEGSTRGMTGSGQRVARLHRSTLERGAGLFCRSIDALTGALHGTCRAMIVVASGDE